MTGTDHEPVHAEKNDALAESQEHIALLAQAAAEGFYGECHISQRLHWEMASDHSKGNWRRAVRAVLKTQKVRP